MSSSYLGRKVIVTPFDGEPFEDVITGDMCGVCLRTSKGIEVTYDGNEAIPWNKFGPTRSPWYKEIRWKVEHEGMREAVNFLRTVYTQSVPDCARIMVAEADEDVDVIREYLITVRDYTEGLINKLQQNKSVL